MKALLKNNIVIELAEEFNYIEGVWETPSIRLGYLVDPKLQVVEATPQTVVGQAYIEGGFVTLIPTMQERNFLSSKIDGDSDLIYAAVQGNRGSEYVLAEAEATAFKAANYLGAIPNSVASWASAKSESAQWAADSILSTATAWRGAMSLIRANRLVHKEQAKTSNDLDSVTKSWNTFVSLIKTQLGIA